MEKVNTGGLKSFEYPKGHKSGENKDFDRKWDMQMGVGRRFPKLLFLFLEKLQE